MRGYKNRAYNFPRGFYGAGHAWNWYCFYSVVENVAQTLGPQAVLTGMEGVVMATAINQVNGIEVDRLFETVEEVKKNPEAAQCKFRARNKWINGGHNRARIRDFVIGGQMMEHDREWFVEMDEPPALLGEDKGLNPVEALLAALSGCITTSMIVQASAQGIHIDVVESEYEGDLDLRGLLAVSPDVRNGYSEIRVKFKIKADVPDEQLRDVVKAGQDRSPVYEMVSASVPVKVTCEKI